MSFGIDTEHLCFPETDGERELVHDPCRDHKNRCGLRTKLLSYRNASWRHEVLGPAPHCLLCMLLVSIDDLTIRVRKVLKAD